MQETTDQVISAVQKAGLTIDKEKIQAPPSWKYLGYRITEKTVTPQPLQLKRNPKTLNEVQQLVGAPNWPCPLLGISNQDLAPLSYLLKGDTTLNSPWELKKEAQNALGKVTWAIQSRQAHRYNPNLSSLFAVLGESPQLHSLIFQWGLEKKDHLILLEWVFLSRQLGKTITTCPEIISQSIIKARSQMFSLSRKDFAEIFPPATSISLECLIQNSEVMQFALENFTGKISVNCP